MKKLRIIFFNLLFILLGCEFLSFILIRTEIIQDATLPSWTLNSKSFWSNMNIPSGVWHEPFAKFRHQKACFDVSYEANSYGARDQERNFKSKKNRIVVLGDSFIEGYGNIPQKRFTNLLEKKTGLEHLNFGSCTFGPTQEYFLYKSLAKKFDHDGVPIAILPRNDFFDDDLKYGQLVHPELYKPYFTNSYPNYQIKYFNPEALKDAQAKPEIKKLIVKYLNAYSYAYHLFNQLVVIKRATFIGTPLDYSGYYDFSPEQFDRMKYALEKILEEAKGKKVAIFTIATLNDLKRYENNPHLPLSEKLKEFSKAHSIAYLDLLPLMVESSKNWQSNFFSCDGHWNETGHAMAADFIEEKLGSFLYGSPRRPF